MGFLTSLGQIGSAVSGFAPIIGGLESISGLIGDGAARQRALQAQQQAMQAYGQAEDAHYQNLLHNNNLTLMGAAGQGGTALTNYGANLGAANAGAGVYNSSATSGALAQGQAQTNQSLASLGAQNEYNANNFFDQSQANLAQMRLGQANTNYGNANQDYHNSQAGFGHFLESLGQSNLLGAQPQKSSSGQSYMPGVDTTQTGYSDADLSASSLDPQGLYGNAGTGASGMAALTNYNLGALGANAYRPTLPQVNGTQNQGVNLGGNAGGLGNGGQGAGGSNPFYPSGGRGYSQIVQNPYGGPLGGR